VKDALKSRFEEEDSENSFVGQSGRRKQQSAQQLKESPLQTQSHIPQSTSGG
jgi:hypothetical protein